MVLKPGVGWFLFALASVTATLVQLAACNFDWCTGVLSGDIVSLSKELDEVSNTGLIGSQRWTYIGVILLYGPGWAVSPHTAIVVNFALIYFVFKVLDSLFNNHPRARAGAFFGVIANPYLWFVAAGPNKEIPLILITILYAHVFLRGGARGFMYAALLAALAAAFRDGYGVLLFGLAVLNIVIHSTQNRLAVTLIGALLLTAVFNAASSLIPAMQRNLAVTGHIAETYSSRVGALGTEKESVLVDLGLYFFRLAANSFSLPVRPQFFMIDGSLYPLGITFWIFGVILAAGMLACIQVIIFRRESLGRQLACLIVQILIAVSVSLFVQPRYLMATLPLITAVYSISSLNRPAVIAGGVGISLFVAVTLIALGVTPPLATGTDGDIPSFLQLRWGGWY